MSNRGRKVSNNIHYDSPMKTTDRDYAEARRSRYPNTYRETPPDERSRKDWDHYTALTAESNAKDNEYFALRLQEEKQFAAYGRRDRQSVAKEKSFYTEHRAGLFPEQHERLVEPSRQRHEAMMSTANARDRYLVDHPYGYYDYPQRKRHEGLRDGAYEDTLAARLDFDKHYKYAGDPASSKRDKYGRRQPREY
ncbi:hypothetical protein F9C07_7635 [Aspergillus flavus]|uniref:Uncharacterized protein n=3 Tax=Aspergillus subgen. Circumdati TaxID=2720871 RepID=B8NHR3_ASPFN|nr:uncharacterized protein G4B84_005646 [Aspergillus flavus NRRL3357]EIT76976.1 hypothetical protein Ao3042_06817 [Aspergillus oryzae 3.042]KAB8247469.1 hypothetical protein BDV35DRAFT_392040 [Aspergillus flavus]KDE84165.1 hypothetical protein AO1008_10733 [Aspergillus oryzae 100-8]KAF7620832.1 hypothetical protein AFLA_006127 [Aspergillus flavus NRRL3357]KAJ1711088.1 hypothetical protein NYO67_6755 [Aspergillus flavus]|eukprot:EIT76976.1 hypothetical protein Ao3042_06817 [Aspergillus oryzae 3.042]